MYDSSAVAVPNHFIHHGSCITPLGSDSVFTYVYMWLLSSIYVRICVGMYMFLLLITCSYLLLFGPCVSCTAGTANHARSDLLYS